MSPGPLADVTVLDFTQLLTGPFCTKMLADFGADVVKIERPGGGDPGRLLGPFADGERHPEKSALFQHLNLNKRSLTLDLGTEEGVSIARDLAARADIVIEGFRPGVMERLGLDYPTLSALNPQLTMTSISNFGQTGPYRDYHLSEIVLYGMAGVMQSNGSNEREPLKMAANLTLHQAGYTAAVATLAAYYGAHFQSIPQYVDFAIIESEAGDMARRLPLMTAYQYTGQVARREPTSTGGFPSGIYPCLDGYISVVGSRRIFGRICRMIGQPELAQNQRFAGIAAQGDPYIREEFESDYWLPWVLERTKQEVLLAGQAQGVLCGALNTPADAINDPHFAFRDYFQPIEHPVAGTHRFPTAPFRMSRTPYSIRRPAPLLGQHTDEVL
ncbi:MAG: CoA transferase, partial [Chloroflexi bacterium]|nr:CoA transferase [Chloroflexota bacterium]